MDSNHKSQTKSIDIKTVNSNTILNNRRLQKITTVFRFMEMFFFLAMISRFSSQLPSVVKAAGDYFTGSNFTALISPKFVFVIGNLIVLTLFLKSRGIETGNADLCYEYVKTKSCNRSVSTASPANVVVVAASNKRKISRSKSENPMSMKSGDNETHWELRRSVTEIGRSKNSGDGDAAAAVVVEKSSVEDEMSCEDFRRTVEAFIARQQKILRDEELLNMVCNMGS